MIQKNIPYGLGFSTSIEEDKEYLQNQIADIDKEDFQDDYKSFILTFIERN